MTARRAVVFAISADYARHTGGWIYNERLLVRLRRLGWAVERLTLPAGFPDPSPTARAAAAGAFRALADGTIVLVDQLCISVMPELAAEQEHRLRLVVIVHHPLALEGGVPAMAARRADAERRALSAAALVLATSQTTASALLRDYDVPPERLVVGPPGIDRHAAIPIRRGNGTIHLLSVGAVVPRKDHGLLIEALSSLTDRPWRLRIVGDLDRNRPHLSGLRELLEQRGLGERVELVGALEGDRFEDEWRKADLYVATSRYEGFGMAVAEAVARGLPVITTAAGAIESWLDRRAAIVVPVGDVVRLRQALERAMDEPALRVALRTGALAAATTLPSWEATAGVVDTALISVAAGGSLPA